MTDNNSGWVTIFSSSNHLHANMVKGLLESHDIPVRLVDEHMGSLQAGYAIVVGGIKVEVPSDAVADAKELLSQVEMPTIQSLNSRKWIRAHYILLAFIFGTIGGAVIFSLLRNLF